VTQPYAAPNRTRDREPRRMIVCASEEQRERQR
jgi:hypothetical protein